MTLSLIQYRDDSGRHGVAAIRDGGPPRAVVGVSSILALAQAALRGGDSLETAVARQGTQDPLDLASVALLAPIEHADPAHLMLSGTGLTHLGSAEQRDRMHRAMASNEATQTDSMKMFLMGVSGGKPAAGSIGVQPEWFYKGDGASLVAPGAPLPSPDFALDAGEEPEIAGVYVIADDGSPVRIGFALANEFSDHVTERQNYLWLAHSKLRPAAIGPELLISALPSSVVGESRILRDGAVLWSRPFLSGEDNMSHSIANLEHHHFKYAAFRRPGDVHVHFFGTGTLSFGDGIRTRVGDVFEISAVPFALPLRNPLGSRASPDVETRHL
ncbi:MAG: AraD1 family protein [Casimicrobiaceae bacterium]